MFASSIATSFSSIGRPNRRRSEETHLKGGGSRSSVTFSESTPANSLPRPPNPAEPPIPCPSPLHIGQRPGTNSSADVWQGHEDELLDGFRFCCITISNLLARELHRREHNTKTEISVCPHNRYIRFILKHILAVSTCYSQTTLSIGEIAVVSMEMGKHNAEAGRSHEESLSVVSGILYWDLEDQLVVRWCVVMGRRDTWFSLYPGHDAVTLATMFREPVLTVPLSQRFRTRNKTWYYVAIRTSTMVGHVRSVSVLYHILTWPTMQRILERLQDNTMQVGLSCSAKSD